MLRPIRNNLLDINPLMDLAVALRDQMSCSINELICSTQQEKVVLENLLRLPKLLLRLLEIKVNVQRLDKVGHWVAVLVSFLPDYPDQVLQLLLVLVRVPALIPVCDDGSGEVAEDPWAVCLDCVDVSGREEHFGESLAGGLVVEERE